MELEVVVLWVVCAVITAAIMSHKRRSPIIGLIVGAFLGPFAVLLALASGRGHSIKCRFCRETIDRDASICPRCQSALAHA